MFKKLFLFSLIFFAFFFFSGNEVFGQASEHSEGCRLANQRLTPVDTKRCGDEISPSQSPKTIYVCTRITQQGTGFSWSPTTACGASEDCENGKCIPASPTECSSKSVLSGPNATTLPKTNVGGAFCFELTAPVGGDTHRSYVCNADGTWSSGAGCGEYGCDSAGFCVGPSGPTEGNGSEDDPGVPSDPNDPGGDGNGSSGGGFSGGGFSGGGWFGISPSDGTAWDIGGDPVNYLQRVLEAVISLAGLVAAGFIIFGAYTLITASGEPETIAKAQKMITNAVIGLILAALAFMIVNFVIVDVPMP